MSLLQELSGFERGRFEINTMLHWSDSPPDIPLTSLNSPPAVAVAVPPRLHPVKAIARDIIQAFDWQHLAVAILVAAGFVTGHGAVNRGV